MTLYFKYIFQKSWQKRYCRLFKLSKNGIDRLEVFDGTEDQKSLTIACIIPLESCVKITQDAQKLQPNVFAVSKLIYMSIYIYLCRYIFCFIINIKFKIIFLDKCYVKLIIKFFL